MDLVDLGHDCFLARFWVKEDLDNVLKEGPWFIGQHFLAIKPWESEFSASEVDLSQVAIWVRLLGLPIGFYALEVLENIGSAIRPVLRIDSPQWPTPKVIMPGYAFKSKSISLL